jgi:signal peptidase I
MDSDIFAAVDEMFQVSLAEGREIRLRVDGTSMVPLLKPGDVVIVQRIEPERMKRGDLVVIHREHDLVTHRLVWQGTGQWLTKGDNCRNLDPAVVDKAILGKVIAIERSGTTIDLQGQRWQIKNRWLARLGWIEANVFLFGRRLRACLPNYSTNRGDLKGSIAARLLSIFFRLAARMLIR